MISKEIMELAEKLGHELRQDERLKRLADARHDFDNDKELAALVMEYNVQSMALENVASDSTQTDTVLIGEIQNRIDQLYRQIQESPVYRQLEAAQNDVNELMNAVNNMITFHITGEIPSSCTHNCSTCGGGCSH